MAETTLQPASADVCLAVGSAPSTSPSPTNSTTSTAVLLDATLSQAQDTNVIPKKKKKKKSKKSAKPKGEPSAKPLNEDEEPGPLVLRISRNKHWRYISSYHVCLPRLTVSTFSHHEK
jgi:hypothetical protein